MLLPSQPPLTDVPAGTCLTDAPAEPCLFCNDVIESGRGRYRQSDGAVCMACREQGARLKSP